MPLRCLGPEGESIHAFDMSGEGWLTLERANKTERHLRMPCCSSSVTLKRSQLGTRFFAHKTTGTCASGPEREEHHQLKRLAVMAARSNGWTAETEVSGTTPDGEAWRADVLAKKGRHAVAIEIQWSGQTNEATGLRQERYRRSSIRGLWLLRQPGFPVTDTLPAVCVGGDLQSGFTALIPYQPRMTVRDRSRTDRWHQAVPMEEFLHAVFNRRFRFGVPLGAEALVTIWGALTRCWHERCNAKTRILTSVDITFGGHSAHFTIPQLGEHLALIAKVLKWLPELRDLGVIKPRFSHMQNRSYVSNGCVRCDRIFGEHFEYEAKVNQEVLCSVPIQVSSDWRDAIVGADGYEDSWSVYSTMHRVATSEPTIAQ